LLLGPERSAGQLPQSKIPRAGILTVADSERAPMFDAFREGLRDLGYVEGRNIILEFRLARGNLSRGPQLAAELVGVPVDIIVVEGFHRRSSGCERPHSDHLAGIDGPCAAGIGFQPRAAGPEYYRLHPDAHRAQ